MDSLITCHRRQREVICILEKSIRVTDNHIDHPVGGGGGGGNPPPDEGALLK